MKQRYRVFWKGASHSIIAFFAGLSGCSSPLLPKVSPIEVSRLEDIHCSEADAQGGKVRFYKCALNEEQAFVFNITDCSQPEPLTLSATTRRLIVGMLDTTILEQHPNGSGSRPVLRSLISGVMDATPIVMAVYTVRENSCIEDFIVWREATGIITRTNKTTDAFISLSDALFQRASRIGGKG